LVIRAFGSYWKNQADRAAVRAGAAAELARLRTHERMGAQRVLTNKYRNNLCVWGVSCAIHWVSIYAFGCFAAFVLLFAGNTAVAPAVAQQNGHFYIANVLPS
jgi:hypothetical protein